ncbi:MAG TPA: hypothetical protein EYP98_14320 [Planctomycetes bacterium]|nr:hypothetical protein [Planctomycetota bacterium]
MQTTNQVLRQHTFDDGSLGFSQRPRRMAFDRHDDAEQHIAQPNRQLCQTEASKHGEQRRVQGQETRPRIEQPGDCDEYQLHTNQQTK